MSSSGNISNSSGPGSAAEPSMEEILASIRRILKDDDSGAAPAEGAEEDVLVLDASMAVASADISTATELPADVATIGTAAEPVPEPVHFASAPEPVYFEPEPAIHTRVYEEAPVAPATVPTQGHEMGNIMEEHVQVPEGLVGEEASSEITNTIGSLVRSISSERSVQVSRGGTTIEDIVREEVRPVLKAWLDTHLPSLVERIVRAEIGRVIDRTQI